uniref:Uncharacterized protein n=1 Tax=Chenopodium quinoa TaxID=63459 RepID=A0A803MTL7_CHEQI
MDRCSFSVFDCCFSTDVLNEDEYTEYLGGIVTQLQDYYPDASFMVFNFREGDRRSHITDILSDYDMTVMKYPRQYEKCPLLPLEMVYHFLRSSESWLSLEGQQNVLLMHCERGGWPVLAFILAGLLLYRKNYSGEQKTLEMVSQAGLEGTTSAFVSFKFTAFTTDISSVYIPKKFLMEDIYRNPSPLQFDGPCADDQYYMCCIKHLQEVLDKMTDALCKRSRLCIFLKKGFIDHERSTRFNYGKQFGSSNCHVRNLVLERIVDLWVKPVDLFPDYDLNRLLRDYRTELFTTWCYVSIGRALDLPVYFGDAGSREVLHKVGAERACAAAITLDTPGHLKLPQYPLPTLDLVLRGLILTDFEF